MTQNPNLEKATNTISSNSSTPASLPAKMTIEATSAALVTLPNTAITIKTTTNILRSSNNNTKETIGEKIKCKALATGDRIMINNVAFTHGKREVVTASSSPETIIGSQVLSNNRNNIKRTGTAKVKGLRDIQNIQDFLKTVKLRLEMSPTP
jgi:hypothetical protein